MFSLILVLVGVVLVAAIAIATLYYGGDIFSRSSADAEASTLLAQSAQIASASAAYTADMNGKKPQTLQDLVDRQYLSSIPDGWQEPAEGESLITSKVIESYNACELFNARQGYDDVPSCDDVGTEAFPFTKPVCCQ